MTPIAPLITAFLREHMPIERGYSPHTCETYAHAFRLLFVFASDRLGQRPSQLCLEQIDAALVLNFLTHIEQQRGNDATTRNSRLAAIKAFTRYVEFRVPSALEQVRQIHAIPTKRHDQALVQYLTMGTARLRIGRALTGASLSTPGTEHPCPREGPQGALPPTLERDSH
jgi:site-specific recombinase XerD